ncbi:RING finger protein 11-like isoform X1 [Tachypleus tridentatus]|uniref:RING finger protein 11-like isoform X1 n=1 Tax=Tachypleus tridentatus TaxID=6853 RepID=UPI003FCF4A12
MGNCLKSFGSDDVSLLQENNSTSTRESSIDQLEVPPSYQESILAPVYQSTPNVSHPVSQLTEEQIKVAQHIGLIQHLPTGCYDESKKVRECVICMGEFVIGDAIRYLPCLHTYHVTCIDDWLMRSFTCPSCLEPVDAALLTTYQPS